MNTREIKPKYPKKMVYILRGPSGSGKSSHGKEMAKSFLTIEGIDAVTVSADNFFMRDGEYLFDPALLPQAHQQCFKSFLIAISAQCRSIIVDNTNIHKWEYENYVQVALMFDYSVKIMDFAPVIVEQIKECAKRNVHGVPASVIMKQALEFEDSGEGNPVYEE